MGASSEGARLSRAALTWSIVVLATVKALLTYQQAIAAGGSSGPTADWLINYSGGFVRRGLFGSLYLLLFPVGQQGLWILFAVQVVLAAVPAWYLLRWLHRSDYDWIGIALVCGPAALTFTGWNPEAFGRKELLTLSALTLLALAGERRHRIATRHALTIGGLLMFALSVFSWEASALLAPGAIFLVRRGFTGHDGAHWRIVYTALTCAIAFGGLQTSVLFHGNWDLATEVCTAVRQHGLTNPELCDNSIAFLGVTGSEELQYVRASFPLYWGYLPWFALSLLPIATTTWLRKHWLATAACAAAIAPLFLLGIDYGRWISLLVLELVICIAATTDRVETRLPWTPLAVICYTTLWGIPFALPPETIDWPLSGAAKVVTDLLISQGPQL